MGRLKEEGETLVDKMHVLQETRVFNETPLSAKKARLVLSRLLFILPLNSRTEATQVFFQITRLFQSNDASLRQIQLLAIKELSTLADDVIMVTASISKDINSDSIYKPNAIRALVKICDMLQSIDRLLKQAIVDKNHAVSSSALVSSLYLFSSSPSSRDIIKRWSNEVNEAISSKGVITQYHALGLMFQIKQHDKMSLQKLISLLFKQGLKSSFALCMLVRYSVILIESDLSSTSQMFQLLESWLRNKNEMVVYEAARCICSLPNVTQKELFPAVSALHMMLLSNKPCVRFAAMRTLNKLAMTMPVAVWPCNVDMEGLINDPNRSIATFAITTLLKTGMYLKSIIKEKVERSETFYLTGSFSLIFAVAG